MKTLPKNILFTGIETPLSYLYEEVIFLDKNIFVGKKTTYQSNYHFRKWYFVKWSFCFGSLFLKTLNKAHTCHGLDQREMIKPNRVLNHFALFNLILAISAHHFALFTLQHSCLMLGKMNSHACGQDSVFNQETGWQICRKVEAERNL